MSDGGLLVYGAYGYTGRLVARAAVERGRSPTLAGRRRGPLEPLATDLGCRAIAFRLDEQSAVEAALENHDAVLNCAGPFAETCDPFVSACLATETDYLDLTGELDVFQTIHDRDPEATEAGVTLLPGVGFDVVATDCLASHLAERLPDATSLTLAFDARGGASDGTIRTAIRGLADGGRVRRNGTIERVPLAWRTRSVDFGDGPRETVTVPWGDVATAYHSTGIPDTTVYMAMHPDRITWLRRLRRLTPVLGLGPVKWLLSTLLAGGGDGPDAETRAECGARVWGEARAESASVSARLRTPNSYRLTVEAALAATRRVLDGGVDTGYQTPSTAFGPDFVVGLPDVEREDVD